jgi:2-polyprenyl-3-methyl-5-hydroxy-6-metoxy-1,4-benzoquinol methylase
MRRRIGYHSGHMHSDSSNERTAQEQLWRDCAERLKAKPMAEDYASVYDKVNRFLLQHGDPAKADATICGPTGDVTDWEKKIIVTLAGHRDKRVLDIGCGDGRMAIAMAQRGAIVKGIDISTVAIECARRFALKDRLQLEFQVGNAIELSEPSDTYDYVVSCDMVEHLNPNQVPLHLREVFRVLKAGGAYIFSLPGWAPKGTIDPLHLGNYRPAEFRSLLQRAGFSPKSAPHVMFDHSGDLTFIIGPPRTAKAKLARSLTKLPFAGPIVARKLIDRWCEGQNFFYSEKQAG